MVLFTCSRTPHDFIRDNGSSSSSEIARVEECSPLIEVKRDASKKSELLKFDCSVSVPALTVLAHLACLLNLMSVCLCVFVCLFLVIDCACSAAVVS